VTFNLLSQPIKKYIYDKRWDELRPIQVAAIDKILSTDKNYILASRTASGKTEAAFLPILSTVDFKKIGVQVLCVSPLISLINDQFVRVEELCQYLDIKVTKWHGEAKQSSKNKLIKNPSGIVLITPESLEAMFVNKPFNVKQLFSNVDFIIVDEIHAFIGADRGIHLKSILSRLKTINPLPVRIIGLSATIGDYDEAKKFTGDIKKTIVLLDKTKKEVEVRFKYFKEEDSLAFFKDLYINTKDDKVLIFPNSRGLTEEIAVKLKKISSRLQGHQNYFSHHSSVDKEIREKIEFFAKNSRHQNFTITCTSTLELGVDIGSVNKIIQVDATHSIASLIQRIGRGGRRENETSRLILYARNEWSLLHSLACWILYLEDYIEPPHIIEKPYDILLYQILSIVKEFSGLPIKNLIHLIKNNFAFNAIKIIAIEEIISHLIDTDILEKIQYEVIIGIEGEKIVNNRDFYGVFKTELGFKVINLGNKIGEIPFSPQLKADENILLAAKIWKIKYIDFESKKIEVLVANDGKSPLFFGTSSPIQPRIREKILEILYSTDLFDFLDNDSRLKIDELRREFCIFNIQNLSQDRPLFIKEKHLELFTFTGTRINRTLSFLLDLAEIENTLDDKYSRIKLNLSQHELLDKWPLLAGLIKGVDIHQIEAFLTINPALLDFSKWSEYLPIKFQVSLLKQHYFDFDGAEIYFTKCNIVNS
jgi:ATP-dependent Lhr-like helicase